MKDFDPSQPLEFSDHFYIDQELRDIPKNPEVVKARIDYLFEEMLTDEETQDRVRHLGEVGGLYRILGELDMAEQYLGEALSLVQEDELEPHFFVVYGIRLAHTWQWQKRWEDSNPMFEELIKTCEEQEGCEGLLDFVFQHHGKNLFDQGKYQQALEFFEKALSLRSKKGQPELIESTKKAIAVAQSKISNQKIGAF